MAQNDLEAGQHINPSESGFPFLHTRGSQRFRAGQAAADTLPNIYIYNRAAFTLDDMGTSNQAYLPKMTDRDTGISHIVPHKGLKPSSGGKF